jgi:iron complex transport system substrate-binding protein
MEIKNIFLIIFSLLLLVVLSWSIPNPHLNRNEVKIKKIISLSPSITKQIIDLEAEDRLIGVTSFHPPIKKKISIVGTIVQPNIEKIISLSPDLVLFSKEDQAVQFPEMLSAIGIKTVSFSKNENFMNITNNYLELGNLIGQKDLALKKIKSYQSGLESTQLHIKDRKKILFFLSHHPLISVSQKSFINGIISDAGGINVLPALKNPYPLINLEMIVNLNPEIIISLIPESKFFFNNILKDYSEIIAIKKQNIYTLPEKFICYYTPKDYLAAKNQIEGIIKKAE